MSAVQANRQVSLILQEQGLREDAERFAYRAQILQRTVLRMDREWGRWLFSWFLYLVSGYSYRLRNSVVTYVLALIAFTILYWVKAGVPIQEAPFVSLNAFHGRGIQPDLYQGGQPGTIISGIEAFVGLVVEATFIATLIQRFFGK